MGFWRRLQDVFEPDPPDMATLSLHLTSEQLRQQIELTQIGNFKHRTSAVVSLRLFSVFGFVIFCWHWIGGWLAAFWLAFSFMHTLASLKSADDFFNSPNPGKHIRFWKRRTLQMSIVSGLTLGFAGFFFLIPNDPIEQMMVMAFVVGLTFASIPMYATWLPSLWVYIPSILFPTVLKLVILYDPPFGIIFLWLFLTLLIIFYFGYRINSIFTQAIVRSLDREHLMEQLIQQRQNADYIREASELAIQDRTRFFAAANHDLRQPLQAMGIFISLLENQVDAANKPMVTNLAKACNAVSTLVDQIMIISKLETKSVKLNPTHFSIATLFEGLESEFGPMARAKGLTFEIRQEEATLYTDCILLERVIRNLLGNAVRYTEKGGIVIRAKKSRKRSVIITVSDSGVGIPESDRKRLFDEYYRGESGQRAKEGFGLGLSIVKKITKLLNISISVHSRVGVGTIFRLEVPLGTDSVEMEMLHKPEKTKTFTSLEGKRILLIEDDNLIRQSVKALLEGWGAEVMDAEYYDAQLAADVILSAPIDLIFSDFNLGPGHLTGLQAIFRIRSAVDKKIPAIISTAASRSTVLAQYEEETEGFDFSDTEANLMQLPVIIQKPVSPSEINQAISQQLKAAKK